MTHPTADLLRRAAARLRAFATTATPGPWTTGTGDYGWTVDFGRGAAGVDADDSEQARADTAYIAAMHPGVGTALADWLDLEADVIDARAADGDPEYATDTGHDHAEILARQILGEPKEADDA